MSPLETPFIALRVVLVELTILPPRHLKRYLITLQPRSKVEIHTTDQYAGFSDRTQLAVFATRHIPSGTTLLELQGRRVALPVEWLTDEDGAKARRRNDFSLIRSGRKGKNGDQLFLGTARFVNVSDRDEMINHHSSLSTTALPMFDSKRVTSMSPINPFARSRLEKRFWHSTEMDTLDRTIATVFA